MGDRACVAGYRHRHPPAVTGSIGETLEITGHPGLALQRRTGKDQVP
jgi:hypothetical protein